MASWFWTRNLVIFTIAWAIIMMSYSAWQTQTIPGNWKNLSQVSNETMAVPAFEDFCEGTPYKYLRPFALGISQASSGVEHDPATLSICPWPESNSGFRLFVVLMQLIFLVVLMFENFISRSALSILFLYTFAFGLMVTFSIDAYAAVTGSQECSDSFANTAFGDMLTSNSIEIICHPYNFNGMVVIDLAAILLNFGIMRMWATCDDKFGVSEYGGGGDGDQDVIPAQGNNYA